MGHLPFTHPYRLMVHGRYSAFHRDCEKSGKRPIGGHQSAWLALVDKVETQEMDVLRLLHLLAILAKRYWDNEERPRKAFFWSVKYELISPARVR
jgi:hypothetical protein